MKKLGLIAGGGGLPKLLAERCRQAGRPFHVIRLRGFADPELAAYEGVEAGIAELGRCFTALRQGGCEAVCLAGVVSRPDFNSLKPDLRGMRSLPGAIAAARRGDDALLRFVLGEFEREGFMIEAAQEVDRELTLQLGPLGSVTSTAAHAEDKAQAIRVAKVLGEFDIGQAAVVVDGVVLAVEAQEGTDAMLRRCAELPRELRGTAGARRGVLAKWPKPIQDRRIDLPTIGERTIELAAEAGLSGLVGEVCGLILIDRDAVVAQADSLGLFVEGIAAEPGP